MEGKQKKYYVLLYEYVPNMAEKRVPHLNNHKEYVGQFLKNGKLKIRGPYADSSGALLIFEVESASEVDEFYTGDPYYKAGLVVDTKIKEWSVVGGDLYAKYWIQLFSIK